ncbi:hypothetical protein C8F01DRAFT_1173019, partial [Mycena amicta]
MALYNVGLILSLPYCHTITSVLLLPIAKEVGSSLPGNHAHSVSCCMGILLHGPSR